MNDIAENETKRIFNNISEILTTGNKSLEQYLEELNAQYSSQNDIDIERRTLNEKYISYINYVM